MIRKPWPIIILSLIFILLPFINITFSYIILQTHYSFIDYLYSLMVIKSNYLPFFNMVFPSLLAGFAIFKVRKWSYIVFLICMTWLSIDMIISLPTAWTLNDLFLTVLIPMSINILYVSYILLPNVRAAYFNPKLRWWENKPRYVFKTDVLVFENENEIKGSMTNISEGGMFLELDGIIDTSKNIKVDFVALEIQFNLKAKIVYQREDKISCGIQFIELTKLDHKKLQILINKLDTLGVEVTRPIPVWTEDFINWVKKLFTSGKGLIPELPNEFKK
jgi:hypothetical protein